MPLPVKRCEDCDSLLRPCPARVDGEETYVGYYPCQCEEARTEDRELDEIDELFDLSSWPQEKPGTTAFDQAGRRELNRISYFPIDEDEYNDEDPRS